MDKIQGADAAQACRITAIAAAMSLAAGWAGAQSTVQIFGTMDAGVLTQNRTTLGSGNVTRLESSGMRPSVIGFKGTEDLGGGLKAFFNLESHIALDTGGTVGDGFWRRQANVGLQGGWGQLTLGRQYGPALLAHIDTEPRAFKEQFSNLYAWAYDQNVPNSTATIATNNDVGIFFKNAIQYRNQLGPVNFGVMYALGEQAGGFSKGSVLAVGGAFKGPVVLSASYEFVKDAVTGNKNIQHSGFGAALPLGDFTFKANYLLAKNLNPLTGVRVSKVSAWGVGADYKWLSANVLTVAYYDNKDKDHTTDRARSLVVSNDYSFSKRTTLYAQFAYVDAKAGATAKTTIVARADTPAGRKTSLINVGINHTF